MFSKSSAPKSVTVRLEFSKELYPDPFRFTLRRTSRKEKDSADQLAAVGAAVDPVDWLADMLTAPPEGFADFPVTEAEQAKLFESDIAFLGGDYRTVMIATPTSDKPLPERLRAYFLDTEHPELIDIAQYVREAYFRIVLPSFLFR